MTQSLHGGVSTVTNSGLKSQVTTYGALILPYDIKTMLEQNKPQTDPKTVNSFKGKLMSALGTSTNKETLKAAIKNPSKTFNTLATYMKDNRVALTNKAKSMANDITSKFSGIAVAQALVNGKVTSKEALDYLFMGFAPALGVQGSLMGYSGLNQIKDALFDGSINVGAFVSGLTRTIKGATDLKDMLTNKKGRIDNRIIEFDLTISHSETYQSEAPDRRVQAGFSLNEYIHNMPDVYEVQCALQDGKRYSKPEFRAIMEQVRKDKDVVALVLGDELFENLIITNFNPNNDCSKSGMDYTLSFKKITRCDIDTSTVVTISEKPPTSDTDSDTGSLKSSKNTGKSTNMPNVSSTAGDELGKVSTVVKSASSEQASGLYHIIFRR